MGDWSYNPFTGNIDRIGDSGPGSGALFTINGVPPDVDGNFEIESSDGSVVITPLADGIDLSVSIAGTTCLFSAYRSSTASDVTGDGTAYTIPFNTAVINLSGSYNTGTGVFTAPTTGNYLFTSTVNIQGLLTGHTEGIFSFNGSNYETRFARYNMGAMATSGVFSASGSVIVPMTAGQTMSVFVFVTNGAKVVDVVGAAAPVFYTNFSGYLIP